MKNDDLEWWETFIINNDVAREIVEKYDNNITPFIYFHVSFWFICTIGMIIIFGFAA